MGSLTAGLQIAIYVDGKLWDKCVVLDNDGILSSEKYCLHSNTTDDISQCKPINGNSSGDESTESEKQCDYTALPNVPLKRQKHLLNYTVNGYFLSLFINILNNSKIYREHTLANLRSCIRLKTNKYATDTSQIVQINLVPPMRDVIDLDWNDRINYMLLEQSELDHAMSWFSTFGGAFSALGEEFDRCSEIAGKISLHQLGLALRLGDPLTVSRCKLYWALSKIQQGRLKDARRIVVAQYRFAYSHSSVDTKLVRMCLGIWAKLKYTHHLELIRKKECA